MIRHFVAVAIVLSGCAKPVPKTVVKAPATPIIRHTNVPGMEAPERVRPEVNQFMTLANDGSTRAALEDLFDKAAPHIPKAWPLHATYTIGSAETNVHSHLHR